MKIYVITQGSYSDYHIIGVTEDRIKAENIQKIFNKAYCGAEIEEYDTEDINIIQPGYKYYCVTSEGDVEEETYYIDLDKRVYEPPRWSLSTYVFAKDEEHARKIAQDRFAEYRAEKEGLV